MLHLDGPVGGLAKLTRPPQIRQVPPLCPEIYSEVRPKLCMVLFAHCACSLIPCSSVCQSQ